MPSAAFQPICGVPAANEKRRLIGVASPRLPASSSVPASTESWYGVSGAKRPLMRRVPSPPGVADRSSTVGVRRSTARARTMFMASGSAENCSTSCWLLAGASLSGVQTRTPSVLAWL